MLNVMHIKDWLIWFTTYGIDIIRWIRSCENKIFFYFMDHKTKRTDVCWLLFKIKKDNIKISWMHPISEINTKISFLEKRQKKNVVLKKSLVQSKEVLWCAVLSKTIIYNTYKLRSAYIHVIWYVLLT